MTVPFKKPNPPLSPSDLDDLERTLRVRLPGAYRDFLLKNDGGRPESNIFHIAEQNNESSVNAFLTASEIISERQRMADRLAPGLAPIGEDDCGNFVCLNLTNGCVLFWDHELEGEDNTVVVASSFEEFLLSLKPFSPENVRLGKVISAWIDPEFLKSLKK